MRISHDANDPGWHRNAHEFRATVNGTPVIGFTTADEELGIVRWFEMQNGKPVERVAFGKVKIERVN